MRRHATGLFATACVFRKGSDRLSVVSRRVKSEMSAELSEARETVNGLRQELRQERAVPRLALDGAGAAADAAAPRQQQNEEEQREEAERERREQQQRRQRERRAQQTKKQARQHQPKVLPDLPDSIPEPEPEPEPEPVHADRKWGRGMTPEGQQHPAAAAAASHEYYAQHQHQHHHQHRHHQPQHQQQPQQTPWRGGGGVVHSVARDDTSVSTSVSGHHQPCVSQLKLMNFVI